jgi:hypothetical protein
MLISTFPTLREAFEDILPLNEEYILIAHQLEAEKNVPPHFNDSAHEWVIMDSEGEIDVIYGSTRKGMFLKKGTVHVIHFPPTIIHGLETKIPMKYFVIRSTIDATHYL